MGNAADKFERTLQVAFLWDPPCADKFGTHVARRREDLRRRQSAFRASGRLLMASRSGWRRKDLVRRNCSSHDRRANGGRHIGPRTPWVHSTLPKPTSFLSEDE